MLYPAEISWGYVTSLDAATLSPAFPPPVTRQRTTHNNGQRIATHGATVQVTEDTKCAPGEVGRRLRPRDFIITQRKFEVGREPCGDRWAPLMVAWFPLLTCSAPLSLLLLSRALWAAVRCGQIADAVERLLGPGFKRVYTALLSVFLYGALWAYSSVFAASLVRQG